MVSKYTRYKEDKDIPFDNQWTVESFLQGKEYWLIIIGAPFGIGKTSVAKHMAVLCNKIS
jgi:2-phosphoglycerate kinase